jgi:hypothetical protein
MSSILINFLSGRLIWRSFFSLLGNFLGEPFVVAHHLQRSLPQQHYMRNSSRLELIRDTLICTQDFMITDKDSSGRCIYSLKIDSIEDQIK